MYGCRFGILFRSVDAGSVDRVCTLLEEPGRWWGPVLFLFAFAAQESSVYGFVLVRRAMLRVKG